MTGTNITERHRRVRRLALQMLYQIDARGVDDFESITGSLREAADDPAQRFEGPWRVLAPADPNEHHEAFERAKAAWAERDEADRIASELSPAWPTHRQPVLDRNVIRLCWFEMTRGGIPPKVAVNEAIELGKAFGTDRSAHFLNGVLDKMLRMVREGHEHQPASGA